MLRLKGLFICSSVSEVVIDDYHVGLTN